MPFTSQGIKALFKAFGTKPVHCLYAMIVRKSHGGTELPQYLSFAMLMDMLLEHIFSQKRLLRRASPITALSCLAGKLGFQVHFKECPWLWIEAYLARELCRSNSK